MDKEQIGEAIKSAAGEARIMLSLLDHKAFPLFRTILGKHLKTLTGELSETACPKCKSEEFMKKLDDEFASIINKAEEAGKLGAQL